MTKKNDQEKVTELFSKMNLSIISEYQGCNSKIEVQCNQCQHKQKTTLSKSREKIQNNILPCSNCYKQSLKEKKKNTINCENKSFSLTEVDKILEGKKILRTGEINTSLKKIDCKCLMCNKNIKFDKRYLLRDKRGCGFCSKYERISNEIIDRALQYRPIVRISNFIPGKEVLFRCNDCSGEFKKFPYLITGPQQHNCPRCKASRGEKLIQKFLVTNKIPFCSSFNISKLLDDHRNLRVDFYISKFNLVIEFNGVQHYQPVNFGGKKSEEEVLENFRKQIKRDEDVKNILIKNRIDLVSIDGREFKNFNKLWDFLEDLFTKLQHIEPENDLKRKEQDDNHFNYLEKIHNEENVNSLVPLPSKFVDERGVIQNIIYDSIASVSLIESKADSTRSNHKHSNSHYLYILSGICHYYEKDDEQSNYSEPRIFKMGEMIYTPANKIHKTYFPVDTILFSLNSSVRDHSTHEAQLTRIK